MKRTARERKRLHKAALKSSSNPVKPAATLFDEQASKAGPKYAMWAVLTILTLAVFASTIAFDFVSVDDPGYVIENPYLKTFPSTGFFRWAFTTGYAFNWHPLTWISHALDVWIYGFHAGGHHTTNLLFHLINTILLFEVLRRMTRAYWRSAIVAALFAIHPLHVESVAWIAERKDVMSAFLFMLTVAAYMNYVKRRNLHRYLMAAALLALGLMTKPMLVSLPIILLLLDYWPLGRITSSGTGQAVWSQARHLALEKIPLMCVATVSCVVTFLVQRHGGAVMSFEYYSLGVRVKNAIVAYGLYLIKMIWPSRLAAFYPHKGDALPLWEVLFVGVILAAITVFVLLQARRRPYLLVGWLWYVVALVPVIGIVQVGTQAMADRYTYLPFIGIFIALTWGMAETNAARRISNTVLAFGLCVLVGILAIAAGFQVQHWRNSDALFRHALRATVNNAFAHYNLGVDLIKRGKVDEAEIHFREALRIEPRYAKANNNLGSLLARRGHTEEGISYFKAAIKNWPDFAEAYQNLATAFINLKRPEEAIPPLRRSIELQPGNPLDYFELGNAYRAIHNETAAILAYRQALALNTNLWDARVNLGNALLETAQYDMAVEEYTRAIQLKPGDPLPYVNRGYALIAQREWKSAAETLQQAIQLDPSNTAVRGDLEKLQRFLAAQKADGL